MYTQGITESRKDYTFISDEKSIWTSTLKNQNNITSERAGQHMTKFSTLMPWSIDWTNKTIQENHEK